MKNHKENLKKNLKIINNLFCNKHKYTLIMFIWSLIKGTVCFINNDPTNIEKNTGSLYTFCFIDFLIKQDTVYSLNWCWVKWVISKYIYLRYLVSIISHLEK